MNTHRNRTNHFAVTANGEHLCVEHARNSLGGWHNMTLRVAARLGADALRPADTDGTAWLAGETLVTFERVEVL